MSAALDPLLAMPPATRFLLIVSVAVSLALSTNVLSLDALTFLPLTQLIRNTPFKMKSIGSLALLVVANGHRFFTAFFVVQGLNQSGVSVLLNIYKLYFFSNNLENSQGRFRRNFPDYVWFVLVCGFFLVAINVLVAPPLFALSFPHSQLLSSITFMWLRTAMNENIKFFGIVPIKAYYLPFFDLAIAVMGDKWSATTASWAFLRVLVRVHPVGYLAHLQFGSWRLQPRSPRQLQEGGVQRDAAGGTVPALDL